MVEQTEIVMGKLLVQIEGLIREIAALRADMADQRKAHSAEAESIWKQIEANRKDSDATQNALIELRGTLKGGAMVLAFFQAVVFGAFFWLFSQVATHSIAITELKGYDQHLTVMLNQIPQFHQHEPNTQAAKE